MDYFNDILEKRSSELIQAYNNIKELRLSNPTDEGIQIENLLIKFLKDYLPQKYGIERGYIISTKGEKSLQQDIIIYNANDWVFFRGDNFIVVPIEAVYITIEVKSNLNTNKLKEALKNIESIRAIRAHYLIIEKIGSYKIVKDVETHGDQIRSLVFAFESNTGIINIGKFLNKNKNNVGAIFILTKGMLLYTREMENKKNEITTGFIMKFEKNDELDKLTAIFGNNSEVGSFVLSNFLDLIVDYIEDLRSKKNKKKSNLSQYYKIKYQYRIQKIE
jgi:hypothetical protein